MDMSRYSEDGPGEVKLNRLQGYPKVVPGTELDHTVESLGKAVPLVSVSGMLKWYTCTEGEVPYELKFVAGNTEGCGTTHVEAFFTKEGGRTHLPLQLLLCDSSSCPSAPDPPRNLVVKRLNGTAMNVSFSSLSIVEARSLHVTYYISYGPRGSRKRQAPPDVRVPDGKNSVVITKLDPDLDYDVSMYATNGEGNKGAPSPTVEAPVPAGM